jgi:disulfide bond formation protein DsbB
MPTSRSVLLAIAATCIALVGVAIYLQQVQQMAPCPYCVIQRYLYLAIALFCLAGAFGSNRKLGAGLGLLAALGGLGVVGKHLYVLANPGFSCGIDPMETVLNKIPTATAMPWLFQAYGLCENARDTLLGLSIPAWSAVWFVLVTAALAWVLARRSR